MQLTPEELERITGRTLAHYDRNAQAFWEGTRDHDVSQNIDTLLARLDEPREFFECHPPQPPFGWHPRHSARSWATRSSFYWPGFLADFAAN